MDRPEVTSVVASPTQTRPARASHESLSISPEDVGDTLSTIEATYARDTSRAGVCVADGMGARISVERGALVVADGMGEHRRERRYEKATHGLRRVVLLASTGTITLDALHWCSRLGVGVVVLAPDGTVLNAVYSSGPIGRLVAEDVIGMVTYLKSKN